MRRAISRYTLLALLVGAIPLPGFFKVPDEFTEHLPKLGASAFSMYIWGRGKVRRIGPGAGTFKASNNDISVGTGFSNSTVIASKRKLIPNYWRVEKRGSGPGEKTIYRVLIPEDDGHGTSVDFRPVENQPVGNSDQNQCEFHTGTSPELRPVIPSNDSKQTTYYLLRRSRRLVDEEQDNSLSSGRREIKDTTFVVDELLDQIAAEWKRLGGSNHYPAKLHSGGVTNAIITNFSKLSTEEYLRRLLAIVPRYFEWRRKSKLQTKDLTNWVGHFDPDEPMEIANYKEDHTDAIKRVVQRNPA